MLYFLTGEGEHDTENPVEGAYTRARQVLESKNYVVKTLNLQAKNAIPEDKDTDEILYLQAETQEKLNDRESALQIYHELMLKYPSSLFLQEARERARKLSQLSTEEQT